MLGERRPGRFASRISACAESKVVVSSRSSVIARSMKRALVIATVQISASMTKTLFEKSPIGPWVRARIPIAQTAETTTAAPARAASRALA